MLRTMSDRGNTAGVGAGLVAALLLVIGGGPLGAQQEPADPGLTIYMQNTALVRASLDRRIETGEHTVRVDGLPTNVDVESLLVLEPGVTLLGVHGRRTYQAAGGGSALSLALDLRVDRPVDDLQIAYLTGGIGWGASYVMHVSPDDASARVGGYATITNNSGAGYESAAVQLLAGTVDVNGGGGAYRVVAQEEMQMSNAARAPSTSRQAFAGYHLYDVDAPLTLPSEGQHRLRLLGADGVPVEREYVLAGQFNPYQQLAEPQPQEVFIRYRVNRPEGTSFADLPLPAGTVRLYREDDQGRVQLLGADGIPNTPAEEELHLTVGRAFDIQATRTQTDYERVGGDVTETAWEIELVNRTDEDVVVQVIEQMHGDWEILSASHEAERLSAQRVRFDVPVPADGEATLGYRVRVDR